MNIWKGAPWWKFVLSYFIFLFLVDLEHSNSQTPEKYHTINSILYLATFDFTETPNKNSKF